MILLHTVKCNIILLDDNSTDNGMIAKKIIVQFSWKRDKEPYSIALQSTHI